MLTRGNMINERMRILGANRSIIRELFEYGKKRKEEIGEKNVFDFSLGNPSVPAPWRVNEAIKSLTDSENALELHGYTSAQGSLQVRLSIAEHIKSSTSYEADADKLYMTVGAAGALVASLGAVVTEGEEVIVVAPYFPEYRIFIENLGGVVREVLCDEETFEPDPKKIAEAINERTAAIILNYPNNPTGAIMSEETLSEICSVLKSGEERYGKPIYIIADEPYRELVYDGFSVPYIPLYYPNTIVCYSFSKSLSIPGERIGYALVASEAADSTAVYDALCGAARAKGYVCAPSLLQKILPFCLGLTSDISVYDRNRKLLYSALSEYGFEVVKPNGAFYMFMKAPNGDANEFSQLAKKYELLLVPSDDFGIKGYVRISYCVSTEQIENSLPTFKKLAVAMGLLK